MMSISARYNVLICQPRHAMTITDAKDAITLTKGGNVFRHRD